MGLESTVHLRLILLVHTVADLLIDLVQLLRSSARPKRKIITKQSSRAEQGGVSVVSQAVLLVLGSPIDIGLGLET